MRGGGTAEGTHNESDGQCAVKLLADETHRERGRGGGGWTAITPSPTLKGGGGNCLPVTIQGQFLKL